MSNPVAAPTEADALHRLAQAMNRVHFPATLLRLLLALLAVLTGNKAFASRCAAPPCRTWRGWILRCLPGLGMRPSGRRAPSPRPLCLARAPPKAAAHPPSS